jgi:hypothetical protein
MRAPPHRPGAARLRAALAAGLLALLVALVAAAATPSPAAATFRHDDDRRHVQAVLDSLARHPGTSPIVYLLGGSSARESITSEPSWRAQIAASGGGRVRAYNFGSSSETYAADISVVERAPDVPTLVLIGVNVGRYTSQYPTAAAPAAAVGRAAAAKTAGRAVYDSHRFHAGQQLSDAAKHAMVSQWLRERYPLFKARFAHHAAELRLLVEACQARGFRAVIVELPVNLPIVRHAWDAPRHQYQSDCRVVAATYRIRYNDFVGGIALTSSDFMDLSHLVEPGRVKYQRRLSRLVATRLHQYNIESSVPRKERAPDNG